MKYQNHAYLKIDEPNDIISWYFNTDEKLQDVTFSWKLQVSEEYSERDNYSSPGTRPIIGYSVKRNHIHTKPHMHIYIQQ